MAVTRERLEARLAELKLTALQLHQQYVATTGAIADIEFWLQEDSTTAIDAVSKPVEPPKED